LSDLAHWLDLAGVAVFAASGALVASRKEMDAVGFVLVGTVTGIGGGTLRDLLLGRAVFWVMQPEYLAVCALVATVFFFGAPYIQRRYPVLLWADAAGLSLFTVNGVALALRAELAWPVAVLMGVMTATFGGLLRDVICNEIPLILRKEIYATAAALGAAVYVALDAAGVPAPAPVLAGFVACFALRALAIRFQLALPAFHARPGRDYPRD
jgi:uncharacterized membrane protein YeiH